jgi:hypothetical protein
VTSFTLSFFRKTVFLKPGNSYKNTVIELDLLSEMAVKARVGGVRMVFLQPDIALPSMLKSRVIPREKRTFIG